MKRSIVGASEPKRSRRIARLLRSVITIALFAAIIQMLRPAPMDGRLGTSEDANRLVAGLERLHDAARERRAAEEAFDEAELNAYLARLIAEPHESAPNERLRRGLYAVNVRLMPERIKVVWATRTGPIPLTFEVSGVPAMSREGMHFELLAVRTGHMPLPGPLGRWVASRLYKTFEKMDSERAVLNSLSALRVGERQVVATID